MREIILGTAGHVDHGKTSLVRALTGIDTDRLKEEKERGITIELGFAFLDLPCGHRLGIVDVPGHERFVKNMVAGAAGIDLVAFVIAADEGIMPQTREHFEICQLLGVARGLVVITKKDMVEPDWLALVEEEVREFLAGSFLDGAPMIAVSSVTGDGIEEVRATLDEVVKNSDFAEATGPFRMPVDRVFSMKGFGAVVTGTSISGRIRTGENAVVYPKGLEARIRGIQVHGRDVDEVEAGRRTAINLQGVEKEMIERGNMLATSGSLLPSYMLDTDFLYLSSNSKKLKNRTRVRVHLGTDEIMGRIVLLEHEELEPGQHANVQLLLEKPVGTWPGDHYVVRSYSPVMTIGGGKILNNGPPKRRRFRKGNEEVFAIYREEIADDIMLLHLRESGLAGLTAAELSIKMGTFGKRFQKLSSGPISSRKILVIDSERQLYIAASVYQALQKKTVAEVTAYHKQNPLKPGMPKEELKSRIFKDLEQKLFFYTLQDLTKTGVIVQDEAVVRLAGHTVSYGNEEQELRGEISRMYEATGLKPPNRTDIVKELARYAPTLILQIIEGMVREKALTKVTEELYFAAPVLEDLQRRLLEHLQKHGEIDAQGFKNMTGLSRKFSIPLLEYFDKLKLTIRVGDKRVLRTK